LSGLTRCGCVVVKWMSLLTTCDRYVKDLESLQLFHLAADKVVSVAVVVAVPWPEPSPSALDDSNGIPAQPQAASGVLLGAPRWPWARKRGGHSDE
jgi:hypothetical protein